MRREVAFSKSLLRDWTELGGNAFHNGASTNFIGRPRAQERGRAVVKRHGAASASPPLGLPSLTRPAIK